MSTNSPLNQSVLHLLHRANQCVGELFQTEMAGVDLTARQYIILLTLSRMEGASQQDIIDATAIDRSTVSQVVQIMIRKGLLKRKRTREDARTYAITLTDEGHGVLRTAEPIVNRVNETFLAALPPESAEVFLDSLNKIVQANREEQDKAPHSAVLDEKWEAVAAN